jgi:hypothetical protein
MQPGEAHMAWGGMNQDMHGPGSRSLDRILQAAPHPIQQLAIDVGVWRSMGKRAQTFGEHVEETQANSLDLQM